MIYSTFQQRPGLSRLLLGLIFVIGVAEVVLADNDILPIGYDWILGCLLFATTLAWMCAAALAGVVSPVGDTVMKYAYGVLLTLPLAIVALLLVVTFEFVELFPALLEKYDWLIVQFFIVVLWMWTTLAGLVGSLAPRDIDARAYIPLVIAPLFMATVSIAFSLLIMTITLLPQPDWVGWEYIGFALLGSYGSAVLLLFRAFLSRLTWVDRLRSKLLFIPMAVSTLMLVILDLGIVLWAEGFVTVALFGLVILAPFGVVTLRVVRAEQCREQQLRHVRVAVAALSIAMASYWVVIVGAVVGGVVFLFISATGWMFFLPITAGIVVAIPAGYLISEMRHPCRNVLVAAIGPGLVMMMTMCFYWFDVMDKGF